MTPDTVQIRHGGVQYNIGVSAGSESVSLYKRAYTVMKCNNGDMENPHGSTFNTGSPAHSIAQTTYHLNLIQQ